MAIDYRETVSDLQSRINIHDLYGSANIDDWMLEQFELKSGYKIFDFGCGTGKQCFLFDSVLKGDAEIIGGDVNDELLDKARKTNEEKGTDIKFVSADFDSKLPFEDNQFDLVSCSFAIYYATDFSVTFKEMHRVIKQGGTCFMTGPLSSNKKIFYDLIKQVTDKPIPTMPGSSRFSTVIFDEMKSIYSKAEMRVFENHLTFETSDPFIEYVRASISEDRRLWLDIFSSEEEVNSALSKIREATDAIIAKDNKLIMTKVVGGILATK